MRLGDVYINKKDNRIIQIDSFATHMGNLRKPTIVVFSQLEVNADRIGSFPSFNGYGSQTEIEAEYELLIPYRMLEKTTIEEALKFREDAAVDENNALQRKEDKI